MSRRGYIHHGTKTIFFWSQKAGCTTLFRTLRRNDGGDLKYHHRESRPWQECISYARNEGYQAVVVTRHPATRSVSCFMNKFVTYNGKPLLSAGNLEGFAKAFHVVYCDLFEKDDMYRNSITFEEYLRTVQHLHESRTDPNENTINGHWDTQSPPAMAGFQYDFIAKIERFPDDLEILCARSGLKFKPTHGNSTPTSKSERYLGNIPACELKNTSLDHGRFLNAATIGIIQELYRDDYKLFEY